MAFKQISLILIISLLFFACGSDGASEPSAQEAAFAKLSGQWTMGSSGSIILDGQDISLNFANFSLSFANGTYQTTNAGDLFSASGTWEWVNENARQLILDSGEEVNIQNLTET